MAYPRILDERVSHVTPARELLRFQLGDDHVDIRGWSVLSGDDACLGVVDRLLVHPTTGKVRWATITLVPAAPDDEAFVPGSVLVPVGLLMRRDDRRAVGLERLTREMLAVAPRLRRRPIVRADEEAVLVAYGLAEPGARSGGDFYAGHLFEERAIVAR